MAPQPGGQLFILPNQPSPPSMTATFPTPHAVAVDMHAVAPDDHQVQDGQSAEEEGSLSLHPADADDLEEEAKELVEWPLLCRQVARFADTQPGYNLVLKGKLPVGRTWEESIMLQRQTKAALRLRQRLDFEGVEDVEMFLTRLSAGERRGSRRGVGDGSESHGWPSDGESDDEGDLTGRVTAAAKGGRGDVGGEGGRELQQEDGDGDASGADGGFSEGHPAAIEKGVDEQAQVQAGVTVDMDVGMEVGMDVGMAPSDKAAFIAAVCSVAVLLKAGERLKVELQALSTDDLKTDTRGQGKKGEREMQRSIAGTGMSRSDGWQADEGLQPLLEVFSGADFCPSVQAVIEKSLDPALRIVKDGATERLASLRAARREKNRELDALLQAAASRVVEAGRKGGAGGGGVDRPIVTKRRGRGCVAIRAGMQHVLLGKRKEGSITDGEQTDSSDDEPVGGVFTDVPPRRGVVLASSNSGATVFVEPPEAVPVNNEIAELSGQEAAEEAAVLVQLAKMVGEAAPLICDVAQRAVAVDLACARARHALWLGGEAPEILPPETGAGGERRGGMGRAGRKDIVKGGAGTGKIMVRGRRSG